MRKSNFETNLTPKLRQIYAPAISVDLRSRPAFGRPRIKVSAFSTFPFNTLFNQLDNFQKIEIDFIRNCYKISLKQTVCKYTELERLRILQPASKVSSKLSEVLLHLHTYSLAKLRIVLKYYTTCN